MIRASIVETKNQLSAYLRKVREGETIVITDHGRAVAQIVPMPLQTDDEILQDLVERGIVTLPEDRTNHGYTGPVWSTYDARLREALDEDREDRV